MTIRRDLNSDSAPVVLLGGYIVLEPRSASHYLLSDQKTRLVEEKRKAARHAASLVQPTRRCFLTAGPPRRGSSKPSTAACPLPAFAIR
jgi:DeoR family deoxyribose operon repressor